MSKRARFETDHGLVTISRGTLTIRDGEAGTVEEILCRGIEFNEDTKSLFADVLLKPGKWEDIRFHVTKTPREIRREMLAEFVTKERGRLQNIVDETKSLEERKPWEEATQDLAAFEAKYAEFIPQPEPKEKPAKKKGKKARKNKN